MASVGLEKRTGTRTEWQIEMNFAREGEEARWVQWTTFDNHEEAKAHIEAKRGGTPRRIVRIDYTVEEG